MKNIIRTTVSRLREVFTRRNRYEIDPRFAAALSSFDMFGMGRSDDDQIDTFLIPEGFGFFLLEKTAESRPVL